MKIYYTKQFKEDLGRRWKRLSLGRIKLRGGTNTGLTSLSALDYDGSGVRQNFISVATTQFYDCEFVKYLDGLQASIHISESDASLYKENFYYQVILVFYVDENLGKESLAFVLYENKDYTEGGTLVFKDLKLTSARNIITIPGLSWECNLKLGQSDLTSFLENPWGTGDISGIYGDGDLISLKSWKLWMVDSISTPGETPWLETTYLNKYGIKVY